MRCMILLFFVGLLPQQTTKDTVKTDYTVRLDSIVIKQAKILEMLTDTIKPKH